MKKIVFLSLMLLCILLLMDNNVNQGLSIIILYWIIMLCIVSTTIYLLIRKRWIQSVVWVIIVASMSIIFYQLGIQIPPMFREVLENHSECISDSRKSNAFISEYSLLYCSQYQIKVKEAFAEYQHRYKNNYSREFQIDKDISWFIVNIDSIIDLQVKGYGTKWKINNNSSSRIVLPIELSDTIILYLNDSTSQNCIDSLVFRKK